MSDRVALLIGNSAYPKSAILKNPTNDAKDLAKKLRLFGFTTTTVMDGTKEEMETALETFKKRLDKAKVGLSVFRRAWLPRQGRELFSSRRFEDDR